MIMMGMKGNEILPSSSFAQYIKNGKIGGVLLYEYNISSTASQAKLSKLCGDLQSFATIPLLISIDQEGGAVNRLKTKYGFPAMPSALVVAQKNNLKYTESVAGIIAQSCAKVGINLNYAPVLDVHNALCPVLGKRGRCFSADPQEIIKQARVYLQQHNLYKVKTVVKHFPGHGNSLSDSHLGMADVSKYWSEKELLPYKTLIEENSIAAIMTAHIINSQLDSSLVPATLSKKIITDVLRNQLNFNGVVMSDDMQMGAISKHYGFAESIKKALLADVDILMFSNNIPGANQYSAANVHATIKKMVLDGLIPMEKIEKSYKRILAWKGVQ